MNFNDFSKWLQYNRVKKLRGSEYFPYPLYIWIGGHGDGKIWEGKLYFNGFVFACKTFALSCKTTAFPLKKKKVLRVMKSYFLISAYFSLPYPFKGSYADRATFWAILQGNFFWAMFLGHFPTENGQQNLYLDTLDQSWTLCLTWVPVDGNIAQKVAPSLRLSSHHSHSFIHTFEDGDRRMFVARMTKKVTFLINFIF